MPAKDLLAFMEGGAMKRITESGLMETELLA
jgi:hypothetical protein